MNLLLFKSWSSLFALSKIWSKSFIICFMDFIVLNYSKSKISS